MSGHSKWNNIKRKKEVVDAKRGKIFTRHAKLIAIAARDGGGDPETNASLKAAIANAKADNVPNSNVEKAIKKGAGGDKDSASYDEILYGAFGPSGVAILIEAITDNKNRAIGNIKTILSKNGGTLAETSAIAWMFQRKGQIMAKAPSSKNDEEVELLIIDSGAEDFSKSDDEYEIITSDIDLTNVRENLAKSGFTVKQAQLIYIAKNTVNIPDAETAEQVVKLMDILEEDDDVSNIFANFEIAEDVLDKL